MPVGSIAWWTESLATPASPVRPRRGFLRQGAALALAAGGVAAGGAAAGASPAVRFDAQGHRGARGLAPENTLAGFAVALAVGVHTLELDVGLTRDDVLVAHHDRTLHPDIARGPDGRWLERRGPALRSLGFAELAAFDVGRLRPGSAYAQGFPEQRPVDGERIPSLAQVFERVAALGADRVRFNIETKRSPLAPGETADAPTFARRLVEDLHRQGMAARSTVQSFDWRVLLEVQRLAPSIPTVYLSAQRPGHDTIRAHDPAGSPWTADIRHADHGSVPAMVRAAGGAVWSPHAADLDADRLAQAHRLGLTVVPWTVNDPATLLRLIDAGVDGLITDRPDRLREAMRSRGLPLPPSVPAG